MADERAQTEEIRAQIAHKVVEFVTQRRVMQNPNISTAEVETIREIVRHLIIGTHTGSGKTTKVMQALDEIGVRWIYAAPFHQTIEQNIERSSIRYYNFLHLKGRKECCVVGEYRSAAEAGIDISVFCETCPFRVTVCAYEANMKNAFDNRPNLAITHAHIQNWLPDFLNVRCADGLYIRDYYNVLIIDENPINCFMKSMTIKREDLIQCLDVLTLTGLHKKSLNFRKIIQFLNIILNPTINYDELSELDLRSAIKRRHDIIRKYSVEVMSLMKQNIISHPPEDVINHILNLWEYKEGNDITKMIYWRGAAITLSYFVTNALNLGLRIIALDGTANELVWHHMLGTEDFELFKRDYVYDRVFQGKDRRYNIGSWIYHGDKTAQFLIKVIAQIAATKRRSVLVVGTKRINRIIQKNIGKYKTTNIEYANYYYLRSMNQYYMTCDTVILACEPNPPQETVNSCVSLSGWGEDVWRLIFREEEMRQAIGRIRQNITHIDGVRREPVEVYIFPTTGVNKTAETSDLLPDSIVEVIYVTHMADQYEIKVDLPYRKRILKALSHSKLNKTELVYIIGCSERRVSKSLNWLYQKGKITKEGQLYAITSNGMGEVS